VTTFTIDVTQDEIDEGQPGNPFTCPIALAINRRFPCAYAEVCSTSIDFDLDGVCHRFNVSREVRHFISDFDEREPVRPFTFVLELEAAA
jgi:hypothetical protein